jgi:Secretion system C-terminal sorting domain
MKNWIITLLLLIMAISAKATHIVGGSIKYQALGNNDYLITLEIYRDCYNGIPFFDDPLNIAVYNGDPTPSLVGNYQFLLDYSSVDTVSILPGNFVCVFPAGICIDKAVYTGIITLPSTPDQYTVVNQRCCRTSILSNLVNPLDMGMTFFTVIDNSIANTSPNFNQDIPVAIFSGVPFIYDGGAADPDGDSLVYSLSTPYHGATQMDPLPYTPAPPPYNHVSFLDPPYSESNMLGGNYPLEIDPETGEFSAIPNILGAFQIAYKVDEYRNGQLIGTTYRDFAFVVVPPEPSVNFDVSGKVMIDSLTPLDIGTVQLLMRDITNDSLYLYGTYSVTAGGDYSFLDIPPGVFYLRAFPDSSSAYFADYLPTYYHNNLFWYDAITVNQCDTSQLYRDIYLVPVDPFQSGNPVQELRGIVKDAVSGQVVPRLSLLLSDPDGNFYQHVKTDDYGMFSFSLVEGHYYIYVDLWNSGVQNSQPPLFEVPAAVHETANFKLQQDRLEFTGFTPNEEVQIERVLSIKPNPSNGRFTVSLPLDKIKGDETLTIWNPRGQQVLKRTITNSDALQLDLPSAGVYFVRLKMADGVWMGKVVIE